MQSYLVKLLKNLTRGGCRFIVCGGVASVLHGVERLTLDLDITIDLTPENLGRTIDLLWEEGLRPRVPIPEKTIKNPEALAALLKSKSALALAMVDPEEPFRHVDIMLTEETSFQRLSPQAVVKDVEGHAIHIISIPDLLSIKLAIIPPRDKDLQDILSLKKLLIESNE